MYKLYFKYGAMGSSKTAQALMCRFNYLQKGFNVLLAKPALDTRDAGVKSRIGLSAGCEIIKPTDNIIDIFNKGSYNVVIIDECQFLTKEQIEQLKTLTEQAPVLCYGLLTNFKTELFEGSKRLIELADSISEIKSVCRCGRKATINAKIVNGHATLDGNEVCIGGDELYEGVCYNCFKKLLKK